MPDQRTISVIGAGLMGHGIAAVFARGGYTVSVSDPDEGNLRTLPDRAANSLSAMGVVPGEVAMALDNISTSDSLEDCVSQADIVIEAAPENLAIKRKIFADLEAMAPRRCLLASNTSVIPITRIVEGLETRDRALGTHWWNPPHMIPLVEVIRTEWTAEHAITDMMSILERVGKTPVRVDKDVAGFIGNRLQHALWREAISLVEHGVCDAAAVDTVINSSFGRRLAVLGPLSNADLVGTDLTLAIHETVLADLENSTEPSPYLRQLVDRGDLGMKTGKGFFSWTETEASELRAKVTDHLKKLETILT